MESHEKQIYYKLEIKALSASTEIWLGDDEGHFVQKENGLLQSILMPGNYTVQFGLGSTCYPLSLHADSNFEQAQIEAGPSCPRPVPTIPIDNSQRRQNDNAV